MGNTGGGNSNNTTTNDEKDTAQVTHSNSIKKRLSTQMKSKRTSGAMKQTRAKPRTKTTQKKQKKSKTSKSSNKLRVIVEECSNSKEQKEVELKIPKYMTDEHAVVFESTQDDIIDLPHNLHWVPKENARKDMRIYFKFLKQLGKGVSGSVYEVVALSNGKTYALKQISRDNKWGDMLFTSECKFLMKLSHPGIVRLVDYYVDEAFFYILSELGTIDLFHRVKALRMMPESQARNVVRKLLEVLIFMHDCNICHRDLKPENVIFCKEDPQQPKLIDFGDALVVRSSNVYHEFVGTHCYLSPERLRQHRGWELKRSDVWTIGVITFEIVTGKRCFYGKTPNCMFEKIKVGKWRFPKNFRASPECTDFLHTLLVPDAAHRPSARAAISHAWLQDTSHIYRSLTTSGHGYHQEYQNTRSHTLTFPTSRRGSTSMSHTLSDVINITPQSVFATLASNVKSSKLKNLLVKHEISRMSEEDYEFVLSAFNKLDRNKDGLVDTSDLMESFVEEGLSPNEAAALARTVIAELDTTGRGRIDIHAFAASHVAHELSVNEVSVRKLFNELDSHGYGYISSQNISTQLSHSPMVHVSDVTELLKDWEMSHEGRIGYQEFCNAMKSPSLADIQIPINAFHTRTSLHSHHSHHSHLSNVNTPIHSPEVIVETT